MQKNIEVIYFEEEELKGLIKNLLREKNAVLLAHNYQRDEVQEIADFTGDSLGLSIKAMKTDADVIIFCGVHFMAETASILSPEKTVILPRVDAGCPMADMITAEELKKIKNDLPEKTQIVCYVNSSADVKAESDICCTSANAVKVADSLDSEKVFMIPDKNLAQYVSKRSDKHISWWDGYCPTHHNLKLDDVLLKKMEHPGAKFMAHPECTSKILDIADHICSTSGMYKYAKESPVKEFIIGTEMGILYRLKKENPDKKFYLASKSLICPNMKITRLVDVYNALKDMKNVVKVSKEVRIAARRALYRMLEVPRDA